MSKHLRTLESKTDNFSSNLYECSPPNLFFNIIAKECRPIPLNRENLKRINTSA